MALLHGLRITQRGVDPVLMQDLHKVEGAD